MSELEQHRERLKEADAAFVAADGRDGLEVFARLVCAMCDAVLALLDEAIEGDE